MIRVAILYDRIDWVLGEIALNLQKRINAAAGSLEVQLHPAPASAADLRAIEKDCDVVHFLSPWAFYDFYEIVESPCVVTIHHLLRYDKFGRSQARADAVCVPDPAAGESLLRGDASLSERLHVTPLGVDCDFFRPVPGSRAKLLRRVAAEEDAILLGFAAKKSSNDGGRKGIDRYWRMMDELTRTFPGRVLLLISGPDWSAEDIPPGLRNNVRLMGYLGSGERPEYFSGLDYYVCLSRVEGGPYPVLECMACGVKTISTPVGVVPSLIADGVNGFVVTADDYTERIPHIIRRCSADREWGRRLGEEARRSVLEHHSWDRCADPSTYEKVYRSALAWWRRRPQKRLLEVGRWEQEHGLNDWQQRVRLVGQELAALVGNEDRFILVDEDQCRGELPTAGREIPFLERGGHYWGPPPDDDTAVRELERLRQLGARHIVFLWPAFWWLDYYAGFHDHLRSHFRCLLENARLVAFDLRRR